MLMDSTGCGTALVDSHLPELTTADQALVTGWLKAAERRNCQPSTLKGYCGALKAFVHSWDGHRPVSLLQVERSHIEHFLDHLEGRGLNPSTINTL